MIDNRKRFRGRIKGTENDIITLVTDTGEVALPFAAVQKAKLVLTDDLINRSKSLA